MFKLNILKKIKSVDWQVIGIFAIVFILLLSFYIFRISTFLPGFSLAEKSAINSASTFRSIFDNPLFAPHKIIQYLMVKIGHNGFLAMRAPSILMGTIVVGFFYSILRRWYSVFISVISTLLLATNSLYLAFTRNASTEITILAVYILIAFGLWLNTQPKPKLVIFLGLIISTLVLYTPGLIWFFIAFIIWQKKAITQIYYSQKKLLIFAPFVVILLLLPLFLSIFSSLTTLKIYLGLPDQLLHSIINLPKNIALIPYQIFYHGINNPALNIVGTPILDIFEIAMLILGVFYFVINNKKLFSLKIFVILTAILAFIALNSSKYLILILPFMIITITYGLNEMLSKWYTRFPNNPIARGLAVSLILIAVSSSYFYNINKYYVAWPQTPITKTIFIYRPLPGRV